jgi:hypothetical protein
MLRSAISASTATGAPTREAPAARFSGDKRLLCFVLCLSLTRSLSWAFNSR